LPAQVDAAVYEWIYNNLERVPGYARYASYYRRIKSEHDPLEFLKEQESAYWACETYLQKARRRFGREPKILEVGCGAGYFTYALRHAGYNVIGSDISIPAIQKATHSFGQFYRVLDIEAPLSDSSESFDILIMLEVIEHVPNPVAFLSAARRLLSHGGEIILTSPNKDIYPASSVWSTDLPPVHLFWFTEDSVHAMAKRVNAQADICDFSNYFASRYVIKSIPIPNAVPTFSSKGELLVKVPQEKVPTSRSLRRCCRSVSDLCGLTGPLRNIRNTVRKHNRWVGKAGPTLAACLRFD
jgi:2-polyprenyl-3-methyl-5-hydroxy-6-metoxy-1,4-benzoquinol methylase